MKLISLNTWGGKLYQPLIEFVVANAETTDIFCFQEVYFSENYHPEIPWIRTNLASELQGALPGFSMTERLAVQKNGAAESDAKIGEAIFVKDSANVTGSGGFHTYQEDGESAREKIEAASGNFQFVALESGSEAYVIGNVHGLWFPGPKFDTAKRIEQSVRLKKAMEVSRGKKILCGDFNLQPSTESVGILDSGMRDLITEYHIAKTRSRYYEDMEKYHDYIADYMFVSSDVRVADFKVLPDEVSDHLPLVLEFS